MKMKDHKSPERATIMYIGKIDTVIIFKIGEWNTIVLFISQVAK